MQEKNFLKIIDKDWQEYLDNPVLQQYWHYAKKILKYVQNGKITQVEETHALVSAIDSPAANDDTVAGLIELLTPIETGDHWHQPSCGKAIAIINSN